jgi:hypothetical protein
MDISFVALVSVLLLLAAVGLMASHFRSWRICQRQELDPAEFDYRRRQFRRRMQTSAMLGIVAVAILVGHVLTLWLRSPEFAALFCGAIILLVVWTCLLALIDIWATQHYFGRLRYDARVEQARLQAELRRLQALRGNGKSGNKDPIRRDERQEGGSR